MLNEVTTKLSVSPHSRPTYQYNALHIQYNALHIQYNALHIQYNALHIQYNALHIYYSRLWHCMLNDKKAEVRKRSGYLLQRCLHE